MKKIKFKAPDGYTRPEDADVGEEFETLASFSQDKDGVITVVTIDGTPLNSEVDEDEDKDVEVEETANDDEGMSIDAFVANIANQPQQEAPTQ